MIRKLSKNDRFEWEKLYSQYGKFYNISIDNEALNTLWQWLHDYNHLEWNSLDHPLFQ